MPKITDAMDLDQTDIARLKQWVKWLEEETDSGGICVPIRAILHRKNSGKFDWYDEWQPADNWDGIRHIAQSPKKE